MAGTKRVFQVAKEFNVSNETLITYLTKLDFPVKTHMSPITEEMYDEICKKYKRDSVKSEVDASFRKRLREKKLEEARRKERAKIEIEERIRLAHEIARKPPKRKEPSKEEVLKIAEAEAKAEAKAELREDGWQKKPIPEESILPVEEVEAGEIAVEAEPETELAPEEAATAAEEEIPDKEKAPVEQSIEEIESEQVEAKEAPAAPEKPAKKPRKEKAEAKPAPEPKKAEEEPDKKKKRKKRKKKRHKISEEEIEASIKQTLAAMEDAGKPRRRRRRVKGSEDGDMEVDAANVIRVTEFISAADLAKLMNVEPSEVLQKCMELGMMVTINQRLDMDSIIAVADEFGFDVEQEDEFAADLLDEKEEDREEDLERRPPVVTIMGHVDHGKTSLLDYVRRSNIIAGEAGGITQHIGAYEVTVDGKQITFLDTPGHEAFTAMRARGAQVTDIVILIVAADDGVQQQTLEAISHAKAAGVPIVVAVNKIDRPGANPDNIKQQLAQHGVLVESWGGKYQSADISAKTGEGIDRLLELILLEAELLELKANPHKSARGVVIEAELDRGKGPVATILVQSGTLKIGDAFVAGVTYGKVRAMLDERGKNVKKAPPSTPVRVVGFTAVPQSGDRFIVMKSDKEVKDISLKRQQLKREQEMRKVRLRTLDQISKQIQEGDVRELRVVVKGDVDGSVEAIADSLMKLSTDEVAVDVIHKGVGGISETDVNLAAASDAIIIGFNVLVTLQARALAEQEDVDIRSYKIIYDAVNDVKAALEGMLSPELKEEITGTLEVRETFKVPKIGTVAGCYVLSGKIRRNDKLRLYREDKLIYEGKVSSLKRFKDDVREVAAGFECGVGIDGYDDIHVSDVIECVQITEVQRTLE